MERSTRLVRERFDARVRRSRDAVAVETRFETLTYGELDQQAAQLARLLSERGVGAGARILTLFDRCPAMFVAQLAAWKLGAAFVPADPAYPRARLQHMIDDARVAAVVTTGDLARAAGIDSAICVDDAAVAARLAARVALVDAHSAPRDSVPSGEAYVIFTSGTTGKPKGAAVSHDNLAHLVAWQLDAIPVREGDRASLLAAPAFDAAIWESWHHLVSGVPLVIADDDIRKSPDRLLAWLVAQRITRVFAATPLCELLLDLEWPAEAVVRELMCGGERLNKRPPPGRPFRLWNLYGPAECTIVSVAGVVSSQGNAPLSPRDHEGPPSIGTVLPGWRAYVLDGDLRVVDAGTIGELWIGGVGVGLGYVDRAALTAERFVPDPFTDVPGARMYRTGDLARQRSDGELDCLGRVDHEVKIRGFRIDLGEIEAQLALCTGVGIAVVTAREDVAGDKRLVAYVVRTPWVEAHDEEVTHWRARLAEALPPYMIPSAFVTLDALPMTPNGKVDRTQLPAPAPATRAADFVPARTDRERAIVTAAQSVLAVPRIGMRDDLLDLGLHSLSAIRLVARLRRALGVELPIRVIFEARTPERIALQLASAAPVSQLASLASVVRTERLPVTSQERRLWFVDKLMPGSIAYNECAALEVRELLDSAAFTRAVVALHQRHEALRTRYLDEDGRPFRQIDVDEVPSPSVLDVLDDEAARTEIRAFARRPFDIAHGLLWRAALLRVGGKRSVVAIVAHHLVLDRWSAQILFRDLGLLYEAERSGRPAALPEHAFDYADWAALASDSEGAEAERASVAHFVRRLTGLAPIEILPDRPRPPRQSFEGEKVPFTLSREITRAIGALARQEDTTTATVLLTALEIFVHRYTSQERFAIAMPVAGRPREELDDIVGFFVNTVAIDADVRAASTVRETLRRTRDVVLEAHVHSAAPYEAVVAAVEKVRDAARPPLCSVAFAAQPRDAVVAEMAGSAAQRFDIDVGVAKFDLLLYAFERDELILLDLEFATALFERSTAERFTVHYQRILEGMLALPDARVAALDLMPAAERAQVISAWNDTALPVSEPRTVHGLFEAQAKRSPERVAVVAGSETLTYRELDRRANRVAGWLLEQGVALEDRVAVEVERSADMLSAVLGVMKAGGAYVPVDAKLPEDRKRFMKEDAGARVVLDDATLSEALVWDGMQRARILTRPEHLAYVLYTSGSTGRPKGVMVEHRSVANLIASMKHEPGIDPDETTLSLTTLSFDVSVAELFLPLAHGAKVVIGSREVARDPAQIAALIAASGARTFGATPPTWRMMVDSGWRPTKEMEIHCAGEALPRDLAASLMENGATLWNLYGPTEATVYASGVLVVPNERITIGRPLRNTQLYVVDAQMQPVPIGVAGELCIAGAGLARGYLGRPELTAEKFVACPFSSEPEARMYRTGDLARWLPNGELDYLGRLDHQVKVRGYRIELGEIESVLGAARGVRSAVVLAREDIPGDKRLVAYVVPDDGVTLDAGALAKEIGRALPEYMVPSAFVVLERFPVTPNGKLDRRALPAPDFAAAAQVEHVAPRTPVESTLCEIFQQVLRIERVGVHDDFFRLGGHSLLATQVVSRIRSQLQVALPVRVLFEATTVERLAARVEAAAASSNEAPPIPRVDRTNLVRASFAQTRLWFLDQLEGPSPTYNVPIVVRIEGDVDASVLERVVQALADRHETLRTTFVAIDGEPQQQIHASVVVPLVRAHAATDEEARARLAEDVHVPFDLASGPLFRALLIAVGPSRRTHVLALTTHHIATDGWSNGVLLREISALHNAFARGNASPLGPRAIDYADYAAWQRAWLSGDVLAVQLAFWKKHLAGAPAALELPLDRPRPAKKQYAGGRVTFALPRATADAVNALARREGATAFMVLLGAYQVLLSRWSGQADVVVGTGIANRIREELEPVVGFFVNTLAMRTTVAEGDTFASVVRRVKETSLAAYSHQDVPFEQMVDELKVPRDLSRTPIFQAFFVMQNMDRASIALDGLDVTDETSGLVTAKFDMQLVVEEPRETLRGYLTYDAALFDHATMERFIEHFGVLLEHATRAPQDAVAKLPLMTEAERHRVLVTWNATTHDVADRRPVHELFEAQAARAPERVAVITSSETVTYRELDERANRVAGWLAERGVAPEERVAVEVERTANLLAAVLGVMKAGGAYVPVDASLPEDRKRFMKEDAGVRIVLDDAALAVALRWQGRSRPRISPRPEHLAYVLYTSGSTGRPKGVMVEHRSVANLVAQMAYEPGIDPEEITLSLTTLSFDVSVAELFLPLAAGAKVVIGSREVSRDPAQIAPLIAATGARTFGATPPTWRMMVDSGWRPTADMEIHCAGEALPRDLAASLMENGATLWNLYGPTETTVYASGIEVKRDERITIGRPLRNTQLYIVDAQLQPVPIGVAGELCIAGAGLARGYLGRPELTAEKFVACPFGDEPHARMYRTGDLARWLPTGEVDYLGRLDHQVKVRGYRIELGEIEAVLGASAGVRAAVVLAREDTPGEKRLVAYVVPAGGVVLDVSVLEKELGLAVPEYMVPSAFVIVERFPVTPNGKLDRKALPAPDFAAAASRYVAPTSAVEQTLCEIFQQLLRIERVGIHDDFFRLGGHSLLATQLVSRIRAQLDVVLPVRVLFESSTVAQLAARIESNTAEDEVPPIARTKLAGGSVLSFWQESILAWERAREVSYQWLRALCLELDGDVDRPALLAAIRAVLARQESLRLVVTRDSSAAPRLVDPSAIELPFVDLRDATPEQVSAASTAETSEPFALDGAPLVRFRLLQRGATEYLFFVSWHQLVHDATSAELVVREILETYAALVEKREPSLAPLPFRYVDYAAWERAWFDKGAWAQVAAARARIAGAPALVLPADRARTGPPTTGAVSTAFALDEAASERFSKACSEAQVTFFMGAVAIVGLLLGRACASKDVTLLSPISTRTRDELKHLAGRFGNWIPLRVSLDGDVSVREVFERVRKNAVAGYGLSVVPASLVYGTADVFSSPLGQVVLNMPELDGTSQSPVLEYGGLRAASLPAPKALRAVTDLVIVLVRRDKRVLVTLGGASDLFDVETVGRLAKELEGLFRNIELDARVSAITG